MMKVVNVLVFLFLPVSAETKIFRMFLNYLNPGLHHTVYKRRCMYTCYQIENIWTFAV